MIRQLGSLVKPSLFAILAILAATQSATAAKPSSPPPFRYQVVYLGTLPGDSRSLALSVNSFGEVVGYSHNATSGRAFLYRPGTGMLDLNSVSTPP
jgi:probable HAF family extracellular repeat protein